MNRYFYLFILLFFFASSLSAQTATVSIGTVKSCADQDVLVSVNGSNLFNIKALTLYINVDPALATFISLENIDVQLNKVLYNFIISPPKIAVSWTDLTVANFSDKKLFDLKFHVNKSGLGPLGFMAGCQISDVLLQDVPTSWLNGTIEPANPIITGQPKDISVKPGKSAGFEVISANAANYQWERSRDGLTWQQIIDNDDFNGSTTNLLTIYNVQASMTNDKFRCFAGNGACITISDFANLTVESASSVENERSALNLRIGNHPNPFDESTQIEYTVPEEGNVRISIFSVIGTCITELINRNFSQGQYKMQYCPIQLPGGIYLCQMEFKTATKTILVSRKIIKK